MINEFVVITSVVFFILTLVWSSSGLLDLTIKTMLGFLTLYGGYLIFTLQLLG